MSDVCLLETTVSEVNLCPASLYHVPETRADPSTKEALLSSPARFPVVPLKRHDPVEFRSTLSQKKTLKASHPDWSFQNAKEPLCAQLSLPEYGVKFGLRLGSRPNYSEFCAA